MIGNTPNKTNESNNFGDKISEVLEICANCVPAFTNTAVPTNMPNWLAQ